MTGCGYAGKESCKIKILVLIQKRIMINKIAKFNEKTGYGRIDKKDVHESKKRAPHQVHTLRKNRIEYTVAHCYENCAVAVCCVLLFRPPPITLA